MRARLARPRRIVRGRLVAPVAAAAAVALVGGVVVAAPDAPTVDGDVQTVAGSSSSATPLTVAGFTAGADFSFDIQGAANAVQAGIVITDVAGLPDGLTYADGVISGQPTVGGSYTVTVIGTVNGAPVSIPATLVVTNADGTAPAGVSGGSTAGVEGSLSGQAEAGGQVTTGSDGTDAILRVVAGNLLPPRRHPGAAPGVPARSTRPGGSMNRRAPT